MSLEEIVEACYPERQVEDYFPPIDLRRDRVTLPPYVRPRSLGANPKLTVAVQDEILKHISRGAWDYRAAEAVGISHDTFRKWKIKYPEFKELVMAAAAQACIAAEETVLRQDPLAYLVKGPGKDRPGRPGWGNQLEVTGPGGGAIQTEHTYNLQALNPDQLEMLRNLLKAAQQPKALPEKTVEGERIE